MEDSYIFQPTHESSAELQRLDRLHKAFCEFFNGRLSLAPLEEAKPRTILEMGCGGGAWAIDAATHFPEATVHAVDINPIPSRILPPNVIFQQLNLCDPFPFEDASFDVVHARLVLFHLPNAEQVLERAIKLVKSSGWLIIEEPDETASSDNGVQRSLGSQSALVAKFHDIVCSRGADPSIGRHLQHIIETSGYFSMVNAKQVEMPVSGQEGRSPAITKLGDTWRQSHLEVTRSLSARYAHHGITEEMVQEFRDAIADPNWGLVGCMYFAWAQRKVE